MATSAGSFALTGCNVELKYDVLSQSAANNTSTVRLYVVLNVTNNYISWSSGTAWVHTSGNVGIGTYYAKGSHTLLTRDYTFTHNNDGNLTIRPGYGIDTTYVSGYSQGTIVLPKINRIATINTFTNDGSITKAFRATYTTRASGYTYKLRISMPDIVALDTISNYASGTDVYLSDNSVKEIRRRTSAKTVQLGGVIETWSGSTKIGESSEIKITCNTRRPIHLRINSEWKEAYPYVRINGEWKEAAPHVRTNDSWKEGI